MMALRVGEMQYLLTEQIGLGGQWRCLEHHCFSLYPGEQHIHDGTEYVTILITINYFFYSNLLYFYLNNQKNQRKHCIIVTHPSFNILMTKYLFTLILPNYYCEIFNLPHFT